MISRIGFIGLTHLGFIYSLAAAKKGFKVIAFDFDRDLIFNLNNNKLHIDEPGSKSILKNYKKNIHYTPDLREISQCDIVFFSYDTPTNDKLESDINLIKNKVKNSLKEINKKSYFIILSQVIPGFTEKINFPKKNLFYQVETLIFGKAIKRALYPERIIIGYSNNKIPLILSNFFQKFSNNIIITDYATAELSKISINLYLSSTLATTNTINELSKKLNTNWGDLKSILSLDKRIGKYSYLNPGLGLSGGNIERDHLNFINLSKKNNTNASLIKVLIQNSKKNRIQFLNILREKIKNHSTLLIYGLTYKENTHSTKNSIALDIIKIFKNKLKIFYYDKNLLQRSQNILLNYYDFKSKQNNNINYLIILHKPLNTHIFKILRHINSKKNYFIFDPYNYLDSSLINNKFKKEYYYSLKK